MAEFDPEEFGEASTPAIHEGVATPSRGGDPRDLLSLIQRQGADVASLRASVERQEALRLEDHAASTHEMARLVKLVTDDRLARTRSLETQEALARRHADELKEHVLQFVDDELSTRLEGHLATLEKAQLARLQLLQERVSDVSKLVDRVAPNVQAVADKAAATVQTELSYDRQVTGRNRRLGTYATLLTCIAGIGLLLSFGLEIIHVGGSQPPTAGRLVLVLGLILVSGVGGYLLNSHFTPRD